MGWSSCTSACSPRPLGPRRHSGADHPGRSGRPGARQLPRRTQRTRRPNARRTRRQRDHLDTCLACRMRRRAPRRRPHDRDPHRRVCGRSAGQSGGDAARRRTRTRRADPRRPRPQRNRANVLVNWTWNYLTYDRATRLLATADDRVGRTTGRSTLRIVGARRSSRPPTRRRDGGRDRDRLGRVGGVATSRDPAISRHLAPTLVAGAWPWTLRTRARRARVVDTRSAAIGATGIALLAAVVILGFDAMRGPTL